MPFIDLSILNQRQTPAFYADVFANRPAAGFVGRIFISTNTFAFYRDNGTGWDLIGGPGTGTITGSGTAGTIPLWNGASTIGDSDLRQLSSEALILNSATNDWPTTNFANDAGRFLITSATNNPFIILWSKAAFGSGDEAGSLGLGSVTALGSTTFGGALIEGKIENGTDGSGQFTIKTTNTAGVETLALTINSTQNTIFNNSIGINTPTPGAAIDAHSSANIIQQLNQTVATNNSLLAFQNSGAGLWRIGNFYNGGANDLGIFDVIGNIQPVTVKKTSGQVLIGTSTVGSGKLVVASASSDNGIQIVGASAPSLRIDSAESGPTKRAGLGISTATNNFIQGSADRDFCIFNGSTAAASPILFGVYDAGAVNVQEAARISAARNFLIGTTTDAGQKLQVSGAGTFTSSVTTTQLITRSASGSAALFLKDGSANNKWEIGHITDSLYFYNYTSGSNSLVINGSTNAATFSSTITQLGEQLLLSNAGTPNLQLRKSGVTDWGNIQYDGSKVTIGTFAGGQTLNITTGGNVGIGTTSPSNILTVVGPSSSPVALNLSNANANCDIIMTSGAGGGLVRLRNNLNDYQVHTNGIQRTTVTSSGNLLIGTTTDVGAKLVVNGSTQLGSSTVYINTGNDASGNYIETVGNTSNTRAIRIQGINNAGTAYSAVKIASGISKIQLQIDDIIKMEVKSNTINISSIPTSSAGLVSGDIYSNAGILTIVP